MGPHKKSFRTYAKSVEDIRKREYPLLEKTTYLDHAGTTPYPEFLMRNFSREMTSHLFGNPHSHSPSSLLSTNRVEGVRHRMLDFFRADHEQFDLIFVANATAAIKLVMEGIRDNECGQEKGTFWYGYHADSHTSLVGVRELATAGSRCFASDAEVENWLSNERSLATSDPHRAGSDSNFGLFAYPAQSNMNGRRLPSSWPARLRALNDSEHGRMYTLLDAAAFVATAQLDLSDASNAPDFTALSFYKIFGFPDLGALIVRKDAGHLLLKRPYFGGGTVDMVINGNGESWHAKKETSLHEALEDGTLPFHNIIALDSALKVHQKLYGSMHQVSHHSCYLSRITYERLSSLCHANGLPVCTIYKHPDSVYGDKKTQGPTIAFNVQDGSGSWIGKSVFERLAIVNNIQIRTGGVCNPGGIAWALNLTPSEMRDNFAEGLRCGNGFDELNGKPTGIIRVSLGAMSSMKDVNALMDFMHLFIDKPRNPSKRSESIGSLSVPVRSTEEGVEKTFRVSEESSAAESLTTKEPALVIVRGEIGEPFLIANHRCPVSTCKRLFESETELWTHFDAHSVHCGGFKKLCRRFTCATSNLLRGTPCIGEP